MGEFFGLRVQEGRSDAVIAYLESLAGGFVG